MNLKRPTALAFCLIAIAAISARSAPIGVSNDDSEPDQVR